MLPRPMRSALLRALGLAAATLLLLALVEGAASLLLAVHGQVREAEEQRHAAYDPELGWVSHPGLSLADYYGPGRDVTTNSRGFRGRQETPRETPPGRHRLVCSGDSFTFGEGVGDDETWCARLASPHRDTLNLGQPGYGVGQSYLRYLRDAHDLEHQVHLFAFIAGDVVRMGRRTHHGYGKPVLRREGEALVVENVPVPTLRPWLERQAGGLARQLSSVKLARMLLGRLRGPATRGPTAGDPGELGEVARRVFRSLARDAEERGVELHFVYLPVDFEAEKPSRLYPWIRENLREEGLPLIDLSESLRALPPERAPGLFIPEGRPAAGHYSAEGNAWVAEQLRRRLEAAPAGAAARPAPPPGRRPAGESP